MRETEPGGEDQFVVVDLDRTGAFFGGGERLHAGGALGVVDGGGLTGDDLTLFFNVRRSGTTTWRGEMEPAAASGRKGW
ncbi:hypothetical protein GCM10020000_43370 [Streptomyces olivoverticillatus]